MARITIIININFIRKLNKNNLNLFLLDSYNMSLILKLKFSGILKVIQINFN